VRLLNKMSNQQQQGHRQLPHAEQLELVAKYSTAWLSFVAVSVLLLLTFTQRATFSTNSHLAFVTLCSCLLLAFTQHATSTNSHLMTVYKTFHALVAADKQTMGQSSDYAPFHLNDPCRAEYLLNYTC
jgi:hypothetical protein